MALSFSVETAADPWLSGNEKSDKQSAPEICGPSRAGTSGPDVLDDGIEARVLRPGPHDAVVEVEAVHFRPDDVVIDLPPTASARVDRGEPVLEFIRALFLGGHRRGRIVGNAVTLGFWNSRNSFQSARRSS